MDVVTIPCLHDNYAYLIADNTTGEAAVVDPSEAWPVLRGVEERGLKLKTVLCTHHHHDHIGGIEDLLDEVPDLEIIGYYDDRTRIPGMTKPVKDGEDFELLGTTVGVMHTPGHTLTHIVYTIDDHLFVGDTLFGAGCGRLFEGTAEQLVSSLARIIMYSPDAKLYFGHEYTGLNLRFAVQFEPENQAIKERQEKVAVLKAAGKPSTPSSVREELATNPFLRVEEPALIAALKQKVDLKNEEPLTVFIALRELRNHFS